MAIEAGTLVDSNVLLDLFTRDPDWARWSQARLSAALDAGPVLINQIVYAEVSVRFSSIEELDAVLSTDRFVRANLPWSAAFLAGKAFRAHAARGGRGTTTLPDFFIGAHAAVLGVPLLTRDTRRYRSYFPTVELIAP